MVSCWPAVSLILVMVTVQVGQAVMAASSLDVGGWRGTGEEVRGIQICQPGVVLSASELVYSQRHQRSSGAALPGTPRILQRRQECCGQHAEERLPLLATADQHSLVRVMFGSCSHCLDQGGVHLGSIAG